MVSGRFQEDRHAGQMRLSQAFGLNRYNARGFRRTAVAIEFIRNHI